MNIRMYIYIYTRLFFDDIHTNHYQSHIYIHIHIICWFSWRIFCSCQPNHHPIFAGQGGVSFRLESSGRCSVWMQSSAFLEITVFVLVMMLKCKCCIYIYIQYVPFLTGIGKLFNTFGEIFLGQTCGLRWVFSSGSFRHVWKKRCKLAWFLWSLFLSISIKQPTSSLVISKRQGDDFAMRKWVTKAATIDFYKSTWTDLWCRFFCVRSVVFFPARIASRSWLTCKECWTWKQLLNSLTRLLRLYRDGCRLVECGRANRKFSVLDFFASLISETRYMLSCLFSVFQVII